MKCITGLEVKLRKGVPCVICSLSSNVLTNIEAAGSGHVDPSFIQQNQITMMHFTNAQM
jgi:hypothetical protein